MTFGVGFGVAMVWRLVIKSDHNAMELGYKPRVCIQLVLDPWAGVSESWVDAMSKSSMMQRPSD